MRKRILVIAMAVTLGLGSLAACKSTTSAVNKDKAQTNSQLERYQMNQPAPAADRSQYRQTVIDVEQAQIHAVATTTFFFNMGTNNPIKSCPSIGFPVASTAQLTNPEQLIGMTHKGSVVSGTIPQQEPNGVYTGDSAGTYVICVAPNGTRYITYWEGDVQTEGGPAHWDKAQGMIVLDGAPTVVSKPVK